MMSVVAGTRFRGDFEERMNQIIDEIEADGKIILFIDELHTIIGSGSGIDSTLDAANILKPALARGTLHMVGATTQAEYQSILRKMQLYPVVLLKLQLKNQVYLKQSIF